MKENNSIDELFRKGTEHHYPFDESLWAAVEGQLPPQQPKPLLWIFNLNSIALVFMLFVCAIIPTDNTRAIKSVLLTTETNTSEIKPTTPNTKTLSNKLEEESIEPTINTKNEALINGQKTHIEVPLTETALAEIESKNLEKTRENPETKVKAKAGAANAANSSSKNTLNRKNTLASLNEKKSQQINHSFLNDKNRKKRINSLFQGNVNKGATSSQKLDFMHSLDFEPLSSNLTGTPVSAVRLDKRFAKKSFYFELEAMQDISIQKTLTSSNQDLQRLKQDNEKSISQTLIGLNFIKQHKSFIYGVGIHHSKYTERVSYLVDEESLGYDVRYDTSYRLVSGNYNSNGVPVLLINQEINEIRNPTTVIVDGEIVSINTFKRIGIPAFVGIQQNYGNWVAELRTSLSLNYLYQSQGVYLTNDLNQVESINSGAQLKSMIVGNKNDLSIGYAFHEQFAVGTRYSLYQDISSFTSGYESRMSNQSVGVWILWKPE